MLFSGIWKPGAMLPMEVHDPGDHVPPADEAGGIVTRTATHMRSPSANTKRLAAVLDLASTFQRVADALAPPQPPEPHAKSQV